MFQACRWSWRASLPKWCRLLAAPTPPPGTRGAPNSIAIANTSELLWPKLSWLFLQLSSQELVECVIEIQLDTFGSRFEAVLVLSHCVLPETTRLGLLRCLRRLSRESGKGVPPSWIRSRLGLLELVPIQSPKVVELLPHLCSPELIWEFYASQILATSSRCSAGSLLKSGCEIGG